MRLWPLSTPTCCETVAPITCDHRPRRCPLPTAEDRPADHPADCVLDAVRVADLNQITAIVSGAVGAGSRLTAGDAEDGGGAHAPTQTGFVEVLAGGASIGNLDAWGADPFGPGPAPDSGCHFRQTGECSGAGTRQPAGDQPCTTTIPCDGGNCPSGYCECKDGQVKHRVNCHPGSHPAFTCSEFCTARGTAGGTRSTANSDSTSASTNWSTSARFTPNNRNFPASGLPTTGANLPVDDLAAIVTGIYGSVRQLRHHFGPFLTHLSATPHIHTLPPPPPHCHPIPNPDPSPTCAA